MSISAGYATEITDDGCINGIHNNSIEKQIDNVDIKEQNSKEYPKIILNNITPKSGEKVNIKGTVKDSKNKSINHGNILINFNNKIIGNSIVKNGNFNYQYKLPLLRTGKYDLVVKYLSNENYNEVETRKSIQVNRLDSKVDARNFISKASENKKECIHVFDENNNSVKTGVVSVFVNNKKIAYQKIVDGKINYTFTSPTDYTNPTLKYIVVYHQNAIYNPSVYTGYIKLERLNTNIKTSDIVINSSNYKDIEVDVRDERNKNVTRGVVSVFINNKKILSKNVINGKVFFRYTAPKQDSSSKISYNVVFHQNAKYNPSIYRGSIEILSDKKVYVSPNGNDTNNGNRTNPFRTIKKALNRVSHNGIIYLNPGDYNESGMILSKNLSIIGLSHQKNIKINLENQSNVLFYVFNRNNTVLLSNLTIKNSNIQNKSFAAPIVNFGKLIIKKSLFQNNSANLNDATSCMYNTGELRIFDSEFKNNKASNVDGVCIKSKSGILGLLNVNFTNNKLNGDSYSAGAIYTYNTNVSMTNAQFINNSVHGKQAHAGAINTVLGSLIIKNSKFLNNKVQGTDLVYGGALTAFNAKTNIINSEFNSNMVEGNDVTYAGVVFEQNSVLKISNSLFKNNKISSKNAYGGVLFAYNTTADITNSKFIENNADANTNNGMANGGSIYINQGQLTSKNNIFQGNNLKAKISYGGAIYSNAMKLKILENSLTNNYASGTYTAGGAIFTAGDALMQNNNFSKNKAIGKNNGGGAIVNTGKLSATQNNFINNVAKSAGSVISNTGKINTINYNYWGSKNPVWSKLLYKVSKPSKYYKVKI